MDDDLAQLACSARSWRCSSCRRLLLDRRDQHDGAQPLSPEALVAQGHGGAARAATLLQAHRPAARRDPDRQQPRLNAASSATRWPSLIAVAPVRAGQVRLAASSPRWRSRLPDHRVRRDHAQGARRSTYAERIARPRSPGRCWCRSSGCCSPACRFVNAVRTPAAAAAAASARKRTPSCRSSRPRRSAPSCSSRRSFMPKKHVSILLNLFDVGEMTVQDVMVPRARIESITPGRRHGDHRAPARHQLPPRLPVFRSARRRSRRRAAPAQGARPRCLPARSTSEALEDLLDEPYFVPATHAGARAAAVLPGEPRAHRAWWSTSTAS